MAFNHRQTHLSVVEGAATEFSTGNTDWTTGTGGKLDWMRPRDKTIAYQANSSISLDGDGGSIDNEV